MIVICGITIIKHLCKQTWTPNTEQAFLHFSSQDIESGVDSPLLADMSNAVGKSFRPGPEAAARGEYIVQFVRHLGELVCKLEHFGISCFQAGDGFVHCKFSFGCKGYFLRRWFFVQLGVRRDSHAPVMAGSKVHWLVVRNRHLNRVCSAGESFMSRRRTKN